MPIRLAAPVLTLDAGKMHEIDTRNVENLFSMWTVFNRCAESMEEGRRLENLSWRIWNRETFCCESRPQFNNLASKDDSNSNNNNNDDDESRDNDAHHKRRPRSQEPPELSASVDSVVSSAEDMERRIRRGSRSPASPPMSIRRVPSGRLLPGLAGSGREKPISSLALEKMVINIKEKKDVKERLPASVTGAILDYLPSSALSTHRSSSSSSSAASSVPATAVATAPQAGTSTFDPGTTATIPQHRLPTPQRSAHERSSQSSGSTAPLGSLESTRSRLVGSDTSADSLVSHSVVRGFTPDRVSSFRCGSGSAAATPARSILRPRPEEPRRKGLFMLGGSSNEDESPFDRKVGPKPSSSSLTAGLKGASVDRKTTSFKDEVEARVISNKSHEDEDVFESDDEDGDDGDASEDAIEEEDDDDDDVDDDEDDEASDGEDSDWEDSASDGGDLVGEKPLFKRIDSKPNLVSRRSLLTSMMHESDRAAAMADMASKLTTRLRGRPQRSAAYTSDGPQSPAAASSPAEAAEGRSRAKPIAAAASGAHMPLALSPRTTRRNMLASELTESLRGHLLWERKVKNTMTAASKKGLQRRHTAHENLSKLQEYPQPSGVGSKNNSWNDYFDQGLGDFNERGW